VEQITKGEHNSSDATRSRYDPRCPAKITIHDVPELIRESLDLLPPVNHSIGVYANNKARRPPHVLRVLIIGVRALILDARCSLQRQ
jgi:hypothetical protein